MSAMLMKHSGVEWLGEIPAHWDVKRRKFLTCKSLMYGANEAADDDNPDNPRYIRITDIRDDGTLRDDTFRSLPYEIAAPYLLENGDILFARSGSVGRTFRYRDGWGQVCFAGYLIKFSTDMRIAVPKFVDYFTSSKPYWDWLNSISIQTTIQNVNAEKYANLALGIPPLAEQRAIAAYLDRETGVIDALIAKMEQLNALLSEKRVALISQAVTRGLDPAAPLKDSGVEWLGEIPAHWDVKRLKHLATVRTSNVDKKSVDTEREISLLNYTDVYYNDYVTDDIEFMQATATEHQILLFRLRQGDVIVTKDSESWDDIAVPTHVPVDFPGVVCGYHLALIRPLAEQTDGRYIARLFASTPGAYQFKIGANGVTRFGLPQRVLRDALFPLPPLSEQRAIAAYLDRETATIDALVAKNDHLIDLLRENRTSLISAAVTGKIDLRNGA